MTVLNTGSNKKFAAGWEGIFRKGTKKSATKKGSKSAVSAAKKTAPGKKKK